ncbi:MAG TPA: DUF4136 domain-containing protein [Bryobacteraceae bacterium]|nr:DUF4136 domain-containing protein [Bryobacteraceae bacterium]
MSRRLLLLLAALPLLAPAQKISIEFDETRDFSDFRTFAIAGGAIHSKNPSLNNEIVQKNIEAEIRRRMAEKGFTEVQARPDLNVRYSLGSNRVAQREAYPAGWRGWGTRVVTTHFTEGTLVIDLRDPAKHALVWRAIAVEDKADPLRIKDHLADMVRKSIEKYPPKK